MPFKKPQNALPRLTKSRRSQELLPWKRARQLEGCFLYWIPVPSFPIPLSQRQWLSEFLDRWTAVLQEKYQLRVEQFLTLRSIHPNLLNEFTNSSGELKPLPGCGWCAAMKPAAHIGQHDIEALQKGNKKFDLNDYIAEQCYWFVNKNHRKQRQLFFGHGGLTMLYMALDPKAQSPSVPFPFDALRKSPIFAELLSHFDPLQMLAEAYSLRDSFLARSRDLFSSCDPENNDLQKARFVVPLLTTQDFFAQPLEQRSRWFQLFDVYVAESPRDNGVLLASKADIDPHILSIVKAMEEVGFEYPEG